MLKFIRGTVLIGIVIGFVASSSPALAEQLVVKAGSKMVVTNGFNIAGVINADASVVTEQLDRTSDPRRLVLWGRKPGTTEILLSDGSQKIRRITVLVVAR
jgi:hypothetical protein